MPPSVYRRTAQLAEASAEGAQCRDNNRRVPSQPGTLIGVGPGLYVLPRTPLGRTSQNSSSTHSGESTYIARAIDRAYAQSAKGPSRWEREIGMSTITIEKSITINRPADEVWRFLSDENNLIKWQQNLHSHRTEKNRREVPASHPWGQVALIHPSV